jgi:two-component system CheB/CheR fusion protein
MSGTSESNATGDAEQIRRKTGDDFLVVGLGASAGGIKALKEFFANVPPDSSLAYVVILHLSPEHESHLAEVLQVTTGMPVTQVRDFVKIEPNHVYVIPPNKSLAINDGHLSLSEVKRIEERRAPVDIFFRTLAESKHARAVSVVLSGTGADGSMGMKRVKEMGGICVVQDPKEAEYTDMPRHSIATGLVDYVLPVAEMPRKIIAYSERLGQTRIPLESLERPETDEQALRQIFTQLRVRTGHDFSNYKRATVLRRIERRINVNELSDLSAYAGFMREYPNEAQALLKDLLISVTNFFRDCEAFEALERGFIRRLFEGKTVGDQVRAWVAGCATGEEAYTMAMLLSEFTESLPGAPTVQVFATDIDEQAISTARDGFYTDADVADVSPERLRHFFMREANGGYRVRRELRERVLFAHHNLIKDPPFSHLDLVSCRNLLIYLNRTAQERVMQLFHFALNPGGFLFLGGSESIDGSTDLFLPVDKEAHIYQSRSTPTRLPIPTSDQSFAGRVATQHQKEERVQEIRALERLSYADLHQRLVEQYVPPSVVVNEEYDIVHLSERAGRYMQVAGGEPSHNLLKLVRPEIRMELRTALYQAVQNRTSVEASGVHVHLTEGTRLVNLLVRPVFTEGDGARGFILVVFDDAGDTADSSGASASEEIIAAEPAARHLEDELVRVKAQLRATVEQYETQTEELKASNEELQAMNEELRSTAEELETSKEELQSVNEELTTVNQELKIKIEELSQANDDFRNLMNSTDIGTLFLDRGLRVKLFTPGARDLYNLLPADLGRPLSDITGQIADGDLTGDIERVLETLQPIQREVQTYAGRWYLMNILPYRTAEDRIEGIIVTFLDITERKLQEDEAYQLADRLAQQTRIFNTTLSSISDFAYMFDREGRFVFSNQPLLDLLGITLEEIIGKNFFDLNYPDDLAAKLQRQIQQVFDTKEVVRDETPFTNPTGEGGYYEYIFTPVFAADGSAVEVIAGSTRDVTTRKQIETELRGSREHLQLAMDAGKIFSWELNPVTRHFSWSSNMEKVVGFPLLDNIDETYGLLHPDDLQPVTDAINHAIETGGDYKSEFRLVNPASGEASWFYAQGAVTKRTADGLPLFIGVTQNITERKRAEETVRASENMLSLIYDNSPDSLYLVKIEPGEQFRFVSVNETFLRVRGYRREQVDNAPMEKVISAANVSLVRSKYKQVRESRQPVIYEETAQLPSGLKYGEITLTPIFTADGELTHILGVITDVTSRKQAESALRESEERLRLTMESVEDYAILTLDTEGRISSWNIGAERIFGYTEEEIRGQHTEIIFTPEDRAADAPRLEMKTAREDGRAADERWHLRKNGRRFYVSGVLAPLYDGEKLTGYAKIARDLTEQRRNEEELRRAHEDLEHKVEERTRELEKANELLRGENAERRRIEKARLQLLKQLVRVQDDERRRISRDIHDHLGQQSTALRLKLETLKELCKKYTELCEPIEQTQMVAARLDSDVDFLAWELRPAALDDLGLAAALANFVKEWSKHFNIPAEFHATGMDADRPAPEVEVNLYRIAQEALNNTYKHAQASRVDVLLERRDHHVVLIVEDNGVGFDMSDKPEADRGLGLLGMHERAGLIGGTLEIEATPNEGTTIFARVPVTFAIEE